MTSLNSQESLSTLYLKTLHWDSTSELLTLSESENSTRLIPPLIKNGAYQLTESDTLLMRAIISEMCAHHGVNFFSIL